MSAAVENREDILRRIEGACRRAGRPADSVTLLAVSKLQPEGLIREAHAAGQRDFGENYAQELRDKALALSVLEGIRWHAIGPLQTNKAKYVAKVAFAFHALDRFELAQELSEKRTGEPLQCFIQVNVAGEQTKSGIAPNDVEGLLDQTRSLRGILVVGLMCLPPLTESSESSRPYFAELRRLAHSLGLTQLSMGTTADFEVAIEEGATVVRVGTALFGERP